jgi:hypothetical protein
VTFQSLLIHSVTISNPVDGAQGGRYGDPVPGTPTDTVETVRIQPARRLDFFKEELRNRDTSVTRFTMYAMPTSTVTYRSTVIWGTRTFNVVARPAMVVDGTGDHHVEALLEEVEGS